MQNSITLNLGADIILFLLLVFLVSTCNKGGPSGKYGIKNYDGEIHQVICISENGDTVKVWKTYDKPGIIESQGIICFFNFRDLETGKKVEVRTRNGTVVWQ